MKPAVHFAAATCLSLLTVSCSDRPPAIRMPELDPTKSPQLTYNHEISMCMPGGIRAETHEIFQVYSLSRIPADKTQEIRNYLAAEYQPQSEDIYQQEWQRKTPEEIAGATTTENIRQQIAAPREAAQKKAAAIIGSQNFPRIIIHDTNLTFEPDAIQCKDEVFPGSAQLPKQGPHELTYNGKIESCLADGAKLHLGFVINSKTSTASGSAEERELIWSLREYQLAVVQVFNSVFNRVDRKEALKPVYAQAVSDLVAPLMAPLKQRVKDRTGDLTDYESPHFKIEAQDIQPNGCWNSELPASTI